MAAHADLGLASDGSVRAVITPYSCVMEKAEPGTAIDLLLVRRAKKDKGAFFGRSLKKLNLFALGDDAEHYFEATPADRRIIEAQYLIPYQPDTSIRLVDAHRDGLSYWMAQRFLRNALPNDFNEAWGPARGGMRNLAKRMEGCRIVLLMQRKTTAQKYAVELLLVLDSGATNKINELQAVAVKMEKLFADCHRIESVQADVRPAEAVSLRDFWEWAHFDAFDDISMTAGHAGPANHAHGAADDIAPPATLLQRLRWTWIILRGGKRR